MIVPFGFHAANIRVFCKIQNQIENVFSKIHNLFFSEFLFIRKEHINRGDQGGEAPHRDGQLVGVHEVVEEAVDEITEEGEGGSQDQNFGFLVLATAVGLQAAIDGDDDEDDDQERTHHALLGQGTEVLGVGVAAIAGVGADDGLLLRHLVGGIHKLVGAWAPAEDGALVEKTEGRLPTVDALKVGGVGGDVGDGLDVLHQVARSVLVVLLQGVDDLVLESEEQAYQDHHHGGDLAELDLQ